MPAAPRRPGWVSITALVLGAILLLAGVGYAIALGPTGRVEVATRVPAPGIALLGKDVLRASSTPVHVQAKAASGGSVTVIRMLDDDAHAALDGARYDAIDGVSFLPRNVQHVETGDGEMPHALNADTFLDDPATRDLVGVDVTPSRLPQSLVIFPGQPANAREDAVDVTLTWTNAAWFWQAIATALIGTVVLAAGIITHRRRIGVQPAGAASRQRPNPDVERAVDRSIQQEKDS